MHGDVRVGEQEEVVGQRLLAGGPGGHGQSFVLPDRDGVAAVVERVDRVQTVIADLVTRLPCRCVVPDQTVREAVRVAEADRPVIGGVVLLGREQDVFPTAVGERWPFEVEAQTGPDERHRAADEPRDRAVVLGMRGRR
ncbi:hypothetical protein [Streptomyces sp. G7(2002)]|uniref:hypothetical protein n=1 Tax=Streptomyces sp. G7(2002) TaxID=2971798 RepID=UPI00237E9436|nr:hypothetical protein [Streptomyces sp. G7(2002)]WDT60298.1 hypothetical protein NUT86_40320 [Streptomyces sp. G7(2002)]